MYRVLVALDGNEGRAIAQAKYVANLPCAAEEIDATVLFVFQNHEDVPADLEKFKSATRVGAVRRASEILEEADVATTVIDESGDAAADILVRADDLDVDEIVLGRRPRSRTTAALFGSVSRSVIPDADRPVTIIQTPDPDDS